MAMNHRLLRPRASGLVLPSDPDARAYVLAVNAADGQPLEAPVVQAIDTFVSGCKADGIWGAIKASCLLMGARTLSGALTPLAGAAPTNNGPFVSGDYDRKTGLVGNGSTKYLASNRANNADPQNSNHNAVYISQSLVDGRFIGGNSSTYATGDNSLATASGDVFLRSRNSTAVGTVTAVQLGFFGSSRAASHAADLRNGGTTVSHIQASQTPSFADVRVFAGGTDGAVAAISSRLAFYSIGESLDLALLDTRVTTLYNAIGAAI